MPLSRRYVSIASGILLIGGGIAAYLFWNDGGGSTPARKFTVAPVARGDIIQTVNASGQLSPASSVEVSTQISGLVTHVHVDFNSQVKKGEVLAKIDPSTYEQRLRQTEADLAAAEANHRLTEINTGRLKGLREQDLVTQQEFDEAEARLQQS